MMMNHSGIKFHHFCLLITRCMSITQQRKHFLRRFLNPYERDIVSFESDQRHCTLEEILIDTGEEKQQPACGIRCLLFAPSPLLLAIHCQPDCLGTTAPNFVYHHFVFFHTTLGWQCNASLDK